MNPSGMINGAAKQAASAAGASSAAGAATNAINQAPPVANNQTSNVIGANPIAKNPTMSASEMANQTPENMQPNTPNNPHSPEETPANSKNFDVGDEPLETLDGNDDVEMPREREESPDGEGASEDVNQSPEPIDEGPQPGDKVDSGKKVNENGEVEDTATKKTVKAVGRGVAAYFTGGKSLGMDKAVTENEVGDKLLGVVSDAVEKTPGVKQAAEALDELGVTDLANDVMDVAGDVANKDVGSAIEHGDKALKSLDKTKKKTQKKMLMTIISSAGIFFAILCVLIIVIGPVIGGVVNLTEKLGEMYDNVVNEIEEIKDTLEEFYEDIELGIIDVVSYQTMLNNVPDYFFLDSNRKRVISTALSLVGTPYEEGGKPTGTGLAGVPVTGLDSAGFVKWVYWTALKQEPNFNDTSDFTTSSGNFERIDEKDLLPGDICVKKGDGTSTDHVAIYNGNNLWVHAAGESTGISVSRYKDCSIYLRHTELK